MLFCTFLFGRVRPPPPPPPAMEGPQVGRQVKLRGVDSACWWPQLGATAAAHGLEAAGGGDRLRAAVRACARAPV